MWLLREAFTVGSVPDGDEVNFVEMIRNLRITGKTTHTVREPRSRGRPLPGNMRSFSVIDRLVFVLTLLPALCWLYTCFDDLMHCPKTELARVHQCCGNPFAPFEPTRRVCNVSRGLA